MSRHPEFSIVVPAYNEELLLEKFLTDLYKVSQKTKKLFEIIVVANGCTDKTCEIVNKLIIKHPFIKLIQLKSSGYGLALHAGLLKATGKFLVIFNVDYWDKKFITLTAENILGYDAVIGSKLLPGSVDLRPWGRRFVSYLFNLFLRIFLKYPGTDTHGIKILRRSAFLPLIKRSIIRSGVFDSELMLKAARQGLKILELPVTISEIRPARFSYWRFIHTPLDLWHLSQAVSHD